MVMICFFVKNNKMKIVLIIVGLFFLAYILLNIVARFTGVKNKELANRFQIRSVPTVMVFKEGQIRHKQAGMHTRQQLEEILRRNL